MVRGIRPTEGDKKVEIDFDHFETVMKFLGLEFRDGYVRNELGDVEMEFDTIFGGGVDSTLDDIFKVFDEHRHDIGATKCICDLSWDLSRSNNKDILLSMDRNRHRIPGTCQDSVLKEVDIALGRIDPSTVSGRRKTEHEYDKPYFVKEEEAGERYRDERWQVDFPVEEMRIEGVSPHSYMDVTSWSSMDVLSRFEFLLGKGFDSENAAYYSKYEDWQEVERAMR